MKQLRVGFDWRQTLSQFELALNRRPTLRLKQSTTPRATSFKSTC